MPFVLLLLCLYNHLAIPLVGIYAFSLLFLPFATALKWNHGLEEALKLFTVARWAMIGSRIGRANVGLMMMF